MNKHVKESDIIPKPITVLVTLDQLRHGLEYPGGSVNSRKVYRDQDIAQLAHSLLPQNDGQLKPMLCCTHKSQPNLFFVFDGGRRQAAFDLAIREDLLPKGQPIEIKDYGQITPELALQLSWAANEQVPLHPADRAEAFAKLSASKPAEQIAEERGMSLQSVKQSIALGTALAPEAIQLWRENLIAREDVEVLVLGDVEQQQTVLKDFRGSWDCKHGKGINKTEVRRKLMKNKEPEMRRLLGFVGVENYRRAGGTVVEDFFGQGGNVKDMKLLKKLARDAMEMIRRELEGAGWSWVELLLTTASSHHGYGELKVAPKFTPEEAKRVKEIEARLKVLRDVDTDDDSVEEEERLDNEKEMIESRGRTRAFDAKQKAKSGVLVSLTAAGDVLYHSGLVRKDISGTKSGTVKATNPVAPAAPRIPDVNAEVEEALDEVQRQAVKTLLVAKPREAFALFLASIVGGYGGPIDWNEICDGSDDICNARNFIGAYEQLKKLPLDKLAARLAAAMADITRLDGGKEGAVILEALGEKALQAEFARLFDAKVYLAGAMRQHLLGIIAETQGEAVRKTHEKDGDAALKLPAAEGIKKTGWLPPDLRTKAYAGPTAKKPAAQAKAKPAKKGAKKK